MRSARRHALALALAIATGVSIVAAQQVTRVVDGDTIVVEGVGTVRLIGVDTAETVDPREPIQYFGAEASAFTAKLAQGKTVRLEFDGPAPTRDRFNRTLAYAYLPDGTLLNAEIIRLGFGHAYTKYPFARMEEFRRLQREAAENGRGLWADNPTGEVRAAVAIEPQAASGTETVYATRTGTKYHRAGCRSLARSQIPLPLKEAAERYGPCSNCKPPVLSHPTAVETPKAAGLAALQPKAGASGEAATPVLVTRTGTKYHREGCRTLRNGGIPSTLGEASRRFGPCSVCRPPVLSTTTTTPSTIAPVVPSRPASTSGRCQATTKKGTQCSRKAQPGRNYCWQH